MAIKILITDTTTFLFNGVVSILIFIGDNLSKNFNPLTSLVIVTLKPLLVKYLDKL